MNKWIPKLFYVKPDGGKDSGVMGYFLIEWKPFFSIGLLHFNQGTREAYHNHAFNALTWWLKGRVTEIKLDGSRKVYGPSIVPKWTTRDNFHKVCAHRNTWALTLRGPWNDTWQEYRKDKYVTLTHGRKEIQ
jgi:hypothetical protein